MGNAAFESYVANAIGTDIKPQSLVADPALREQIQARWNVWADADAAGLTDFKDQPGLTCQAFLEGGEAILRLRHRRAGDALPVALQIQAL